MNDKTAEFHVVLENWLNGDESVNPKKVLEQDTMSIENMIAYSKADDYDDDRLARDLTGLARLIISRHFYLNEDKEDFLGIAYHKALTLLRADHFDPEGKVINFLYSGIRNEIGNHLRKNRRSGEIHEESRRVRPSTTTFAESVDFNVRMLKYTKLFRDLGVKVSGDILGDLFHRGTAPGRFEQLILKAAVYDYP